MVASAPSLLLLTREELKAPDPDSNSSEGTAGQRRGAVGPELPRRTHLKATLPNVSYAPVADIARLIRIPRTSAKRQNRTLPPGVPSDAAPTSLFVFDQTTLGGWKVSQLRMDSCPATREEPLR